MQTGQLQQQSKLTATAAVTSATGLSAVLVASCYDSNLALGQLCCTRLGAAVVAHAAVAFVALISLWCCCCADNTLQECASVASRQQISCQEIAGVLTCAAEPWG
eukprot:GHUV01030980.1.p1 GENE.GHUV01030980.1~~GHUV01030980.1.p1  ORF type:complete len:105 (-),score=24.44 GHUV01030980.1:557-871(-)